jgi:sugar phosphate isomerase/epimerase
MPKLPIVLQLYTVRDMAERDFAGTLSQVARIGYAGVELAGYHGLPVRELKTILDDLALRAAGSHIALDRIETETESVIEENLTLGNPFVVVPWLPIERRNLDSYKQIAARLNDLGETMRISGLTLCYHNHDFEFRVLENGQTGLDILLGETDPLLVKAEVDTYWALHAGADPVAFIRNLPGRVPLLHLKDRDKSDGSFAEIGTGDLPTADLIAAANEIGTQYLVVEQDLCKRPTLESATISYDNLKAMGYA